MSFLIFFFFPSGVWLSRSTHAVLLCFVGERRVESTWSNAGGCYEQLVASDCKSISVALRVNRALKKLRGTTSNYAIILCCGSIQPLCNSHGRNAGGCYGQLVAVSSKSVSVALRVHRALKKLQGGNEQLCSYTVLRVDSTMM